MSFLRALRRLLDRRSLRARLLAAFALIVALSLVPAAIIKVSEEEAMGALGRIVETDMRVSDLALRGIASFLNARRHEKDFLLRYREFGIREARARYATRVQTSVAELHRQMQALRKLAGDRDTREQTEKIELAASEYLANFLQTVELYESLAIPHRGLWAKLRGTLDALSPAASTRFEARLAAAYLNFHRAALELTYDAGRADHALALEELATFERAAMAVLPAGAMAALAAPIGSFRGAAAQVLGAVTSIAEHRSAYLNAAQRVEPLLDTLHVTRVRAGEEALATLHEAATVRDRYAAVSGAAALLFTLVLAVTIALRIDRGVRSLVAYTGEITDGHLDASAPKLGDKELGRIATALDAMAGRLRESRSSLTASNAEFASANEALRLENAERTRAEEKATRFYALVDNSTEYVSMAGPDGKVFYLNPAGRRMAGIAQDADIGAINWRDLFDDENWKLRLETGLPTLRATGHWEGEIRMRNLETGRMLDLLVHAFKVQDPRTGAPLCIATVQRDITERKRDEAELQRFRAELEQRITDTTTANDSLQRQTEELRRLNEERAALGSMNEMLTACASAEEAYEIFGRAAAGLFPSLSGALHILAASRNQLTPAAAWGEWPDASVTASPESCWGLRRGKCYAGNGTTTPPCGHAGPVRGLATLCVPLTAYGEVLGVLHLRGSNAPALQSALQLATMAGDGLALNVANLRLRDSLKAQSIRDPLTDLFNRRYLTETLEREFARALRSGAPVAVIMLDVDHFKRFNDSYGHDAGDAVLCALAALFRRSIRAEDIACRYGGEEFCLVLPHMNRDGAWQRAEAIRAGAERLEVTSNGRALGPVTLSLGVALYPEDATTVALIIAAADAALYRAKAEGRNRVVVSQAGKAPDVTAAADVSPA